LLQAGLLALDGAGVAGEETLALQRHPQLGICLDKRACDAVPRGAGLSARPAAMKADADVVRALGACDLERRLHLCPVNEPREVLVERAAVDPPGPVPGAEDHARHGGLPLAGALVRGLLCHQLIFSSFGACAVCGCSGPA